MFVHFVNPRSILRSLCIFAIFTSLGIASSGCGDSVVKQFTCDNDLDCEASQSCQGGQCKTADVDKDGWAKNKDCDDNNPLVYPGAPEVCGNQIDDNCNGSVDEDPCRCESGKQEKCGFDKGICRQGIRTCKSNGDWDKCVGAVQPKEEICDGQDNDCDGSIDEDVANCCQGGDTKPCGTDKGECQAGQQKCDTGQWTACTGNIGPKDEVCDNKDNDCDGKIDNIKGEEKPLAQSCYTGPPETRKKGACVDGTQICRQGQWTKCDKESMPQKELCNGKDDDCDGQIDNVKGEDKPLKRNCYSGAQGSAGKGPCREGQQTCVGGKWSICQGEIVPIPESCNDIDDDCDGSTDNKPQGVNPLTQACYSGPKDTKQKGTCQDGVQNCKNGRWTSCQGDVVPIKEECDGKDNDCDGRVDNINGKLEPIQSSCYSGAANTRKIGLCKDGTRVCKQTKWDVCVGDTKPVTEKCDGKDNDCDGSIDNGNPEGGKSCQTNKPGTCKTGVQACVSGKIVCNPPTTSQEVCDNKDNDCNGKIDDNLSRICGSSTGTCKKGNQTCSAGKWGSCAGAILPTTEICDGKDNNCNGSVDEGVQRACGSSVGACKKGKEVCTLGSWGVCIGGVSAKVEACDGIDNNCNGSVDENNPGGGGTCQVSGKQGICRAGTNSCRSGRVTCVQTQFGRAEQCNGKDDNCNGPVDEGASCNRGSECGNGRCNACSKPETKCPGYDFFCVATAPNPPCRCGLVPTCIESSVTAGCAKKKCL